MRYLTSLKASIELMGATFSFTDYTIYLDAPNGYVWAGNDSTSVIIHYANSSQQWLTKAIKEEMDIIKQGLRLATDEELIEIRFAQDDDTIQAIDGSPKFIPYPKG